MKTGRGHKRGRGASGADTSGRIGEESDPDYSSADEGGSERSGSESSAEEEVSSSSSGNEHKGEMRSKRRNDERCEGKHDGREGVMEKRGLRGRGKEEVDQKKGLQVQGKRKVDVGKRGGKNDEREDGGREQWVEVDIRHHCALYAICALNDQLSDVQKESIRGMVWSPVLEYRSFLMDRHLVQALLHSWNPEDKCFKLGRRDVPFSQFDVALLIGFPATWKRVTFERSEGGSEVEEVLKGAMEDGWLERSRGGGHHIRTCTFTGTTCRCCWSCAR